TARISGLRRLISRPSDWNHHGTVGNSGSRNGQSYGTFAIACVAATGWFSILVASDESRLVKTDFHSLEPASRRGRPHLTPVQPPWPASTTISARATPRPRRSPFWNRNSLTFLVSKLGLAMGCSER